MDIFPIIILPSTWIAEILVGEWPTRWSRGSQLIKSRSWSHGLSGGTRTRSPHECIYPWYVSDGIKDSYRQSLRIQGFSSFVRTRALFDHLLSISALLLDVHPLLRPYHTHWFDLMYFLRASCATLLMLVSLVQSDTLGSKPCIMTPEEYLEIGASNAAEFLGYFASLLATHFFELQTWSWSTVGFLIDDIGRKHTIALMFAICGACILCLGWHLLPLTFLLCIARASALGFNQVWNQDG